MEIDARLPTVQAGQSTSTRSGVSSSEPPVPAGAASEFFISPVLRFDSRSLTVIFQVRDSGSGDVIRQFPPETVVARYREDPSARPFVVTVRSGAEDREAAARLDDAQDPVDTTGADDRPAQGARTDGEAPDPVDLVA